MRSILFFLLLAAAGGVAAEPVQAQWKPQQFKFRYSGFTTRYTCDGIEGKIKSILRWMGAKEDVKAQSTCAGGFSEVQPFNTVTLGFSVPVEAAHGGAPGETFAAEWREVTLGYNKPRDLDPAECELVEQMLEQLAPLFNARDVNDRSNCVPHHPSAGDPNVTMTLLVPVEPEQAAAIP